MTMNMDDILSPQGPIARRLGERFEVRPQQASMIHAVDEALGAGHACVVEAGTGVGKSFAYLLPAIKYLLAMKEQHTSGPKARIVVSTHTITLQEQLMDKDIPLIQAALGGEFTAVLVKGRGNYLSLRRLKRAMDREQELFPDPQEANSLDVIDQWSKSTTDGSLASLPTLDRSTMWSHVQSDGEDCMGRRCPTFNKCFYQAARRRMENADLLVVNHALFFSDLAMRRDGFGVLPPYDHVILDEAHTVEAVAGDYFGLSLSRFQVGLLLSSLLSQRKQKGLLWSLTKKVDTQTVGLQRAITLAGQAHMASENLFDELITWQETRGRSNGRVQEAEIVTDDLGPILKGLASSLKLLRDHLDDDDDRLELAGYASRCESMAYTLEALVKQSLADSAYWLELQTDRHIPRVKWVCAPVDVGPLLTKHLFSQKTPQGETVGVVLTSATLATASSQQANEPFAHFATRVGVPSEAQMLLLGSPFDYMQQAELFVEAGLPDPNVPTYAQQISPRILHHLDQTDGGAFVLFTSFKLLREAAHWLEPFLAQRGMPLWVHGNGMQRSQLLKKFRENPRSVLLGADSFWQGVDVSGDGLRNVIITRLPFARPDQPLTEARIEQIRSQGGNAFGQYTLPQALLRFKQGFGRLIRSREDTGRVVVMDSRVMTKSYGRQFIDALPAIKVQISRDPRTSPSSEITH